MGRAEASGFPYCAWPLSGARSASSAPKERRGEREGDKWFLIHERRNSVGENTRREDRQRDRMEGEKRRKGLQLKGKSEREELRADRKIKKEGKKGGKDRKTRIHTHTHIYIHTCVSSLYA